MKQTINKAGKKPDSSWSDVTLQHAAIRRIFEHELPRSSDKSTINHGRDFSRLPLNATYVTGQKTNMTQTCPFTAQRCPFGGACHACPPRVQAKLKIGQPGDKYEQEADRVAEQVMRMPEPQVLRKECSSPECKEEDEDKILQAKSNDSAGPAQVDHPLIQNVLSSPGQPLDVESRSFMEPRFGQNFSSVRVHVGSKAAESAQEINAKAYTVGQDVVFGEGEYVPETRSGQRLLAHELAHVAQQKNKPAKTIQRSKKAGYLPTSKALSAVIYAASVASSIRYRIN